MAIFLQKNQISLKRLPVKKARKRKIQRQPAAAIPQRKQAAIWKPVVNQAQPVRTRKIPARKKWRNKARKETKLHFLIRPVRAFHWLLAICRISPMLQRRPLFSKISKRILKHSKKQRGNLPNFRLSFRTTIIWRPAGRGKYRRLFGTS